MLLKPSPRWAWNPLQGHRATFRAQYTGLMLKPQTRKLSPSKRLTSLPLVLLLAVFLLTGCSQPPSPTPSKPLIQGNTPPTSNSIHSPTSAHHRSSEPPPSVQGNLKASQSATTATKGNSSHPAPGSHLAGSSGFQEDKKEQTPPLKSRSNRFISAKQARRRMAINPRTRRQAFQNAPGDKKGYLVKFSLPTGKPDKTTTHQARSPFNVFHPAGGGQVKLKLSPNSNHT